MFTLRQGRSDSIRVHASIRDASAAVPSRVLARSVVVLALVPAPGTAAPAPAVRAVSRLWKKSARTWFPPAAFPAVEVEVEPGVVGTVVVELETPEALC